MLMTPKSQRWVCHCLPSQDVVPSQLKAHRGTNLPARDVNPCPEPGKGKHRGLGKQRQDRKQRIRSTRLWEDITSPGAAKRGCRMHMQSGEWSCPLCTSLVTSSEQGNLLPLLIVLAVPVSPGTPGSQGHHGDVHFCRKSWWGRG